MAKFPTFVNQYRIAGGVLGNLAEKFRNTAFADFVDAALVPSSAVHADQNPDGIACNRAACHIGRDENITSRGVGWSHKGKTLGGEGDDTPRHEDVAIVRHIIEIVIGVV